MRCVRLYACVSDFEDFSNYFSKIFRLGFTIIKTFKYIEKNDSPKKSLILAESSPEILRDEFDRSCVDIRNILTSFMSFKDKR